MSRTRKRFAAACVALAVTLMLSFVPVDAFAPCEFCHRQCQVMNQEQLDALCARECRNADYNHGDCHAAGNECEELGPGYQRMYCYKTQL